MTTEKTPKAPSWLSDEATEHWNRVAPQAESNRTLDENHTYAFGLMCETIADMIYLQQVIRKEGLCIPGAGDNLKAHPALRQLESCRAHVLKMLESFGLTARSKRQVKAEASYSGIRFGKPRKLRRENDE
jgi:P27 family predicted phage terminase small subunit